MQQRGILTKRSRRRFLKFHPKIFEKGFREKGRAGMSWEMRQDLLMKLRDWKLKFKKVVLVWVE